MIETVLAQPDTGSPKSNFLMMINKIARIEIKKLKVPVQIAMVRGISEKLIKPSKE